jgi:hypothetical protein
MPSRRKSRKSNKRSNRKRRSPRRSRLMYIQTSTFDSNKNENGEQIVYLIALQNDITNDSQVLGIFTSIANAKQGLKSIINREYFFAGKEDNLNISLGSISLNEILEDGHINYMDKMFDFSITINKLRNEDELKKIILNAIDKIPYKDQKEKLRDMSNITDFN